jgi:hypothetical protein
MFRFPRSRLSRYTRQKTGVSRQRKLLRVASDTAHPLIKDQARAFKKDMEMVVAHYMREAIASDRTTIYNALIEAGHPSLAGAIRRL